MITALLLLAGICTPLPTCTPALLTAGTPCATPTGTAKWDPPPEADVAAHNVYWKQTGGGLFGFLTRIDCIPAFTDEDGFHARFCPGADMDIPMQRYCSGCLPFNNYDFAVKAVDSAGQESLAYSNTVSGWCFSPVYVPGQPYTYE